MRKALEMKTITPETTVLDFGCGRNNDVTSLKEMGIAAAGFDPYWCNDPSQLKVTDVVTCIYVLNTIERDWEIPEVVRYCWDLTRKTLVLAVRPGDDHEETTTIGTYQYYWKPKSWQRFVLDELGYDAEFPEAGIAVIKKPATICYNKSVKNSSQTDMNSKEFKKFLSVSPDKDGESNGSPVSLEYEHGMLMLTYKKGGMLVKIPYALNGADEKWSITVDHTAVMAALASVKSKADVSLSIVDGDLIIANSEVNLRISPWGKDIVDFDPDILELDSQVIEFPGTFWAEFVAAARVAKTNKKGVNPEIVGKAVHVKAINGLASVSAWSESVATHRPIPLQREITEDRSFVLPLEAIEIVAAMKSSQITMTLDYKFHQLLIETDIGYVLVDLPQVKYPVTDGMEKGDFAEASVEVKRKDLLNAVKTAVEAGAKNVTLVFDNNTVVVEAAKVKKQEVIPTEIDEKKKFAASIKVAAGALLDALKTLTAAKIFLHFPMAAANSLIIDTVTGIMYVFVVTVKVAAHLIETAADALKKPEPRREVVSTGENSDGTTFVVEAVEASPLQPELSVEQVEEKRAKLEEQFGKEKVDLAEAALDVAQYRERVREILKAIDVELEQLRSLPASSNTAKIKNLDKVQQSIQDDAKKRIAELTKLHQSLSGVVSDAENAESAIEADVYETEFTLDGLEEVLLRLKWWGGRTLHLLWKEEAQWMPQMRLVEPRTR